MVEGSTSSRKGGGGGAHYVCSRSKLNPLLYLTCCRCIMLITSLFARHVLATNPLRDCFYEMVSQTVISVNGDKKIDLKVTSISVKNFNNFSMFFTRHKSVVFMFCIRCHRSSKFQLYIQTVASHFSIFWKVLWKIFALKPTFNPSRPNPGRREKLKLSFYFHTCLWCLKRFYEGL